MRDGNYTRIDIVTMPCKKCFMQFVKENKGLFDSDVFTQFKIYETRAADNGLRAKANTFMACKIGFKEVDIILRTSYYDGCETEFEIYNIIIDDKIVWNFDEAEREYEPFAMEDRKIELQLTGEQLQRYKQVRARREAIDRAAKLSLALLPFSYELEEAEIYGFEFHKETF